MTALAKTAGTARRTGRRIGSVLVGALLLAIAAPVVSAQASPATLSITPTTWNVIGLDSNDVTSGPSRFPVGVRVCNTGTTAATNIGTSFTWDSANAYVSLVGAATLSHGTLAGSSCREVTYEVDVQRNAAAKTTARRFHITAQADGLSAVSTPTPREIYVESLVSQGRNNVQGITGAGGIGDPAPSAVYVGQTYTYKVFSSTSTTYAQLETFLNLPTGIFRLDSISQTYDNPAGTSNAGVYADACGWQPNPTIANYKKCVGPENIAGGKVGGNVVTTYQVTVVDTGTAQLSATIYDFSGSSYHVNSDFGVGVNSLTVTASNVPPPPSADLSMTASASPDPAITGQNVTDTFTISNGSAQSAQAAVFTDAIPAGASYVSATPSQGSCSFSSGTVTCDLGDVAGGASATVAVVLTRSSAGTLSNQASVSSSTSDPNGANNSATASSQVNDPPPPPSADLSMSGSGAPDPALTGQDVTDTFTISNGSAQAAQSVVFTDAIPAGASYVSAAPSQGSCSFSAGTVTCNLGTVAGNGSATVAVVVTRSAAGTLSNQASVSSSTADPNSSNNSATASSQVNDPAPPGGGGTGSPDLVITETATPAPANISQPLTFHITVRNVGTAGATGVQVTDVIPPNMQFVSATPSTGSCGESGGTVTCDLGDLAAGGAITVDVVVIPWALGPASDGASVRSNEVDANPADNSDSEPVRVAAECTIVGTNSPDVIYGTPGNDVICGLWGRDRIYGMGGDDVLFGDWNSDYVYGGDGNDMLWGKAGRDHLFGEAGDDVLKGGYNNDVLDSRDDVEANDDMDGGKGRDVFLGDAGDRQVDTRDN
jgi:uncharacterized repeat protein (TIGR01451 family)